MAAAAPVAAPVAVQNVVTTRPETSMVTWGCLIFVLMALVCAFGGYDPVMNAYRHAVEHGYRFFSYGDAMLLFPHDAPQVLA